MLAKTRTFIDSIGDYGLFFSRFIRNIFSSAFEWNEFFRQCYVIGYRSSGIILLTGFVIGFVLTLQAIPTMKDFGALSYVPSMVSISVLREIGPVITALICAGKLASGIGAELGSMKVTEQIDAMEVAGANPVGYLVVPRIFACIFMIPLLTLFADACAFFGGYAGLNLSSSISMTLFFQKSFAVLQFADVFPSFIKTIFFGLIIGFVGSYKGYHSSGGTESVGFAANSAVVVSSIWIIIVDAIAVQLTSVLLY
jgi:phospholipid/cholesterol/gamma-HCH transport system permease protein